MFALDWISKALAGQGLDQLEGDRYCQSEFNEAVIRASQTIETLRTVLYEYGVGIQVTQDDRGVDVYLSDLALQVINSDSQANQLWAQYLSSTGSAQGFVGDAPTSAEPIYCRAYVSAYSIRSGYGLPCADINPDFLDYWRQE